MRSSVIAIDGTTVNKAYRHGRRREDNRSRASRAAVITIDAYPRARQSVRRPGTNTPSPSSPRTTTRREIEGNVGISGRIAPQIAHDARRSRKTTPQWHTDTDSARTV